MPGAPDSGRSFGEASDRMYLVYVTGLILGLYLAPGLALMPRAAFDSRLAYAVPVVSVLIVTTLARILKPLGLFTETIVFSATLMFAAIAAWRLYRLRPGTDAHWPVVHRLVYLFSICVVLPAAARLGTSSFDDNDEIYSWNMWAVQHVLGEKHDLFYTIAPYPQTFSYLIAWSYQLLGSIDLQLPIKCGLSMLSASCVAAIGTASPRQDSKALLWFVALMVFTLFVARLHDRGLSKGLAEIVMIPALVVSVALYLQHVRLQVSPVHLWLASATAIVAGLSKQPALIWLMLTLPILAVADTIRWQRPLKTLIPVAIAWGCGLLWLVTEGNGFWMNDSVVTRSHQDRMWFQQLFHASNKLLIGTPAITVMLLLCIHAVLRGRWGRSIFFGLVVPSLLVWLLFGAYDLRLGMHLVAVAALLIAANGFLPNAGVGPAAAGTVVSNRVRYLVRGLSAVAVIISGIGAWKYIEDRGPGFSLYDGGKNTIYKYFGDDADFVHREIYRSGRTLWIPSNYIYGIFYGHNPIIRPDHRVATLDLDRLKAEIIRDRPDYLFESGDIVAYGPATALLRDLVAECGDWFETVAAPSDKGYTVYRLNHDAVGRSETCTP